jgi:hypothetical protein
MRHSESIKNLAKALVLAKIKMEAPHKNKTNPHFKNKYADLSAVKESYQTALGETGLSVVSALALIDSTLTLSTSLVHGETGEWIASDYPIPAGLKPQETGSAVSYGRRYNVCALLDIVAEDDDDGEAAQKGAEKAAKVEQPKPTPAAPPVPKAPPVLTPEERKEVTALAKRKGIFEPMAFGQFLSKFCPDARSTADLSRSEFVAVTDALKAMPDLKVAVPA